MIHIIIFVLFVLLFFVIFTSSEKFTLNGNDDDIFNIVNETEIPDSSCTVNDDPNLKGKKIILTTNDNTTYETCDFGLADNKQCNIDFTCQNENCYDNIKPILTINSDYRCRKIPYVPSTHLPVNV